MTTSTGGAAPKRSTILNDSVLQAAQPRNTVQRKTTAENTAAMSANPFYAAMFTPDKSMEERRAEIARLTTTTQDAKKDRENIKLYDNFREWLTTQQTELAEKIIALSNVDSMAELQAVLKDMNTDLMSFEDKMNPLMDIIESIHFLRTNDLMGDAFRDLERMEKEEKERAEKIAALEAEIAAQEAEIARQEEVRVKASTKKALWGFGNGLSKDGLAETERANISIANAKDKIEKSRASIVAVRASANIDNAEDAEIAMHKRRLKDLLDMSQAENQGRMIDLRDSATKFINTARDRTGSLRGQFDTLYEQVTTAADSNGNMIKVYAVLNDGINDANANNRAIRDEVNVVPEDESSIAKMTRETKVRTIDTHASHLSRAHGETVAMFGALTQQAIRISTMQEATDQQIETARRINTEGVAATADRLATVMTAVSGAALGEAAEGARDTLNRMRQSTSDIASREVIRVAMGTKNINSQLDTVFRELEDIREVQQAATGIVRNGMVEMQERMSDLQKSAEAAKDALNSHIASASMIGSEFSDANSGAASKPTTTGFPEV